ncbi:MAG: glycerol-3-phosphate dehydrogenase [Cucumibacter sp.]
MPANPATYDIAIIGGGINGCGIARDAAGRGLSVFLCDKGDLGGATSSTSTKLIHGGLRYLEHYDFALVRESLLERERLWSIAPHIIWPLRLVLPWRKGLRPAWLLRAGLLIYDNLGGRKRLPPTATLDLALDPAGAPLKKGGRLAWEFSDCFVLDNRLVILNARDALRLGATIRPRSKCTMAWRDGDRWRLALEDARSGATSEIFARAVVNATGPWVDRVEREALGIDMPGDVRLVQGSHIVTRKLFDHDRAYFFQNPDGRVLFAIPYEGDFTLIGTTDHDHPGPPDVPAAGGDEIDYLCAAASDWFAKSVTPADVLWTYSGVRPLFDDGTSRAQEATRDFRFGLDAGLGKPPFLSVYGGKITTYRRLAEATLEKLGNWFPGLAARRGWTGRAPLPGGEFSLDDIAATRSRLSRDFPFLSPREVTHFFRHYGLDAWTLLGAAKSAADLGQDFGGGLTGAEVRYLRQYEWAETAEDIVWRRTKRGLAMTEAEIARLETWLAVTSA